MFVSVVMPVRNEAAFIANSLKAVLSQDYPSEQMEVIVADGMSTDGTRQIVAQHSGVRLINNPGRIVPTGLNLAIGQAHGEIIVRVDGHCEIAHDYVRRCVDHLLNDGVDAVGGPLDTIGQTPLANVIAAAMSSSFGVGGSAFRTRRNETMLTDTVAFPAYRRSLIARAGPFDEELVRNQDDEYNYRLCEMGAKILLASDVHCRYYSRSSLSSLWRQYFQYGYWKVRVMQKHPGEMRLRQFVPPLFVTVLLLSLLTMLFVDGGWLIFVLVIGSYLVANLAASIVTATKTTATKSTLWLPVVFATLHISYGLGFLVGLMKFWNRWRSSNKRLDEQRSGLARWVEVVLSAVGLTLSVPLLAASSVAIALTSPGPIIFRQNRVGRNGKLFVLYKLRTMKSGNDGPQVTASGDERITWIGRILRRTKVDELPELWNVLKGDMSLVGPRPEVPRYVDLEDDRWLLVLQSRPGITDPVTLHLRDEEKLLAQVKDNYEDFYRNTLQAHKLQGYIDYLHNRSSSTDFKILIRTLLVILWPAQETSRRSFKEMADE